jgi:hypothetical protein
MIHIIGTVFVFIVSKQFISQTPQMYHQLNILKHWKIKISPKVKLYPSFDLDLFN